MRVLLGFLTAVMMLAAPLAAQSWNRAIFRNEEFDPRDFEYNEEYFLNVKSYEVWPGWERVWAGSDKGYLASLGSVRSDEFYLRQEVKLHLDVVERTRFHWDFMQDEDFDTRYLRNRAALTYAPHETLTVYGTAEGTQFKEDNDVGAGGIYRWGARDWLELQLTAVDFNDSKGKEGREWETNAYGVLVRNEITLAAGVFCGGGIQLQLPMELTDPGEDIDTFRFRKSLYDAYLACRPGDGSELLFYVNAELTGKNRRNIVDVTETRRLDRDALRAGVQYFWMGEPPVEPECLAGLDYFRFRESSVYRDAPLDDWDHDRDEFMVYGAVTVPVKDKLLFRPALYLDYVSQNDLYRNDPRLNERDNGIQAKINGAFEIVFKETIRMVINPTLDLDDMAFGGGNLQFVALF